MKSILYLPVEIVSVWVSANAQAFELIKFLDPIILFLHLTMFMEENVCVSVVFQSVSTMGNFILNSKNFENCVQKIDFLEVRIYSQETARMQDFAPFSPDPRP